MLKSCLKKNDSITEKKSVSFKKIYRAKFQKESIASERQEVGEVEIEPEKIEIKSEEVEIDFEKVYLLETIAKINYYNSLSFEDRKSIITQYEDYGKLLEYKNRCFIFEKKDKVLISSMSKKKFDKINVN